MTEACSVCEPESPAAGLIVSCENCDQPVHIACLGWHGSVPPLYLCPGCRPVCLYCKELQNKPESRCKKCGTWYHSECFWANRSACAVYGCGQAEAYRDPREREYQLAKEYREAKGTASFLLAIVMTGVGIATAVLLSPIAGGIPTLLAIFAVFAIGMKIHEGIQK